MLAVTAKPPDLMGSTEQHKELFFPLLLLFLVFLYINTVIPGFCFFFFFFCPCLERRAESYRGRVNRAVVVARRIPKQG